MRNILLLILVPICFSTFTYSQTLVKDSLYHKQIGDTIFYKEREIDALPQFPNGDYGLVMFLQKNIKYPSKARKNHIEEMIYANFIVEKDGSVNDIIIIKGVDEGLTKETKRVLKLLPKWNPAIKNGHPVRYQYTLPINYKLH